jgi:Fur family ferric uptake transcriptional regulator
MRHSTVDLFILDYLGSQHAHLTSQQVYEHIHQRLPATNPSTVYRALERLAHAGKISVSDMGSGAQVYESLHFGRHHHLVCQNCGAVVQLEDEDVINFVESIQARTHYQIITNHLVLFGLCEFCQGQAALNGNGHLPRSSD